MTTEWISRASSKNFIKENYASRGQEEVATRNVADLMMWGDTSSKSTFRLMLLSGMRGWGVDSPDDPPPSPPAPSLAAPIDDSRDFKVIWELPFTRDIIVTNGPC